jgi:hypothetical protein
LRTWALRFAEIRAGGIVRVRRTGVGTGRLVAVRVHSGLTYSTVVRARDLAAYKLCAARDRAAREQDRGRDPGTDHHSGHPASHRPASNPTVGTAETRNGSLTNSGARQTEPRR